MERRLAAIVCADVAGYSRMMGADEEGTHAAFKAHRSAIHPIILNHGGRLVKNTGDGFLLEFPSVVGAIEFGDRDAGADGGAEPPPARGSRHAIPSRRPHGRCIADEDEVFGDGVNIAVRLESIAAPGGVAVSAKAYHEASKHLSVSLVDAGSHRFKNIDESVDVWTWQPRGSGIPRAGTGRRDRPAVAISNRDRGRASLRQSQRQRRRIFFRRSHRGPDPRALAAVVLPGAQPEFDVRLQGQEPERTPDRAGNRRHLPDPGFGTACGEQDPRHRRTDRPGERRAIMDRPLRPGHRRSVRDAG